MTITSIRYWHQSIDQANASMTPLWGVTDGTKQKDGKMQNTSINYCMLEVFTCYMSTVCSTLQTCFILRGYKHLWLGAAAQGLTFTVTKWIKMTGIWDINSQFCNIGKPWPRYIFMHGEAIHGCPICGWKVLYEWSFLYVSKLLVHSFNLIHHGQH